ncbi:CLUMA_CG004955, isoform A [Clunio marinus]|uniref:CLUMA_CG004955, isoform A n=1 Tax=Clunio marinus TaxID=568069 RepID=A0A1J1HVA0_9DIPT|nr:CLUMA_CG004955, isoform A [Clunio marinus]
MKSAENHLKLKKADFFTLECVCNNNHYARTIISDRKSGFSSKESSRKLARISNSFELRVKM